MGISKLGRFLDSASEGMIPLLFLEGTNPQTKFKSLLDLLSSTFKNAGREESGNKEMSSEGNWTSPDGATDQEKVWWDQ